MTSTKSSVQFSVAVLLVLTALIAMDLAAVTTRSVFLYAACLVLPACSLGVVFATCGGRKRFAALLAFECCLVHSAVLGAGLSTYLLWFEPERAQKSFGLGHPLAAAIVATILGLPYALLSAVATFVIAIPMTTKRKRPAD